MGKRVPYNAKEGCYEDVILFKDHVTDLVVENRNNTLAVLDIVGASCFLGSRLLNGVAQ